MTDASIRHFSYRHPRFATGIRMDIVVDGSVVLGLCESISESGLRGVVGDDLPCGAEGIVSLYDKDYKCSLRAVISFREKEQVGLKFLFRSKQEQALIRSFLLNMRRAPLG